MENIINVEVINENFGTARRSFTLSIFPFTYENSDKVYRELYEAIKNVCDRNKYAYIEESI